VFTSKYTFYPLIYFNYGKFYFSYLSNDIYKHNDGDRGRFYGNLHNSKLEFIINKPPMYPKIFDIMRMAVNKDSINIIDKANFTTELQTQSVTLSTEMVNTLGYSIANRAKFREGLLRFPIREKGKKERMRGKQLTVEFDIKNDGSNLFRLFSVETLYRNSRRT